jgi:hypothetical protein
MEKAYIAYTTEGYCEAPDGEEVFCHQVLGFIEAKNADQALFLLLKENEWIEQREYDIDSIVLREVR